MAWTPDPAEPMPEVKDLVEKINKLIEQKNWVWVISYIESAIEDLNMIWGACDHQLAKEREAGTFVYRDEPEWPGEED